ncbi:FAD:protein FMN transferase [Rasiella rasia]|uniref:FAD:protein FMN transferase n=1 Tax=Rasiella rasia TaxID=2744027 RepID=A0A6G6GPH6_9FLAO|nr:FAD:protein FMN transferase [Rasiella rasia]QIE60452.1 FAD:protein FMN transferase [Rasiella rasia]
MKYSLLFILFISFISCEEDTKKAKVLQGNAFGTSYTIQYFSEVSFNAEKGLDSVFAAVNKSVSTYIPQSDISRINQGDTTVVTDAIFKDVFRLSEEVYTNSNGYFDPTVGTLRNAYGFGDVAPIKEIDSVVLDSLRKYVGFNKVRLLEDGTIRKEYPEIYFDFNAVAKGYGIDMVGRYLENQGVTNFVIELGGEVLAKGKNLSKNKLWTAGIESVDSEVDSREFLASVRLENEAMAASGNYRKFRINPTTGKKYVHTINPLTGFAIENDVTSATVIAPTCAMADAYATTFMAMGLEGSKLLLAATDNIEAYITYTTSTAENGVFSTQGFKNRLFENFNASE